MKKYALVWCSESTKLDYRHDMLNEFRTEGQDWSILSPGDEAFLEQIKHYDGFVISGSEKSVVDDRQQPFVDRLLRGLQWIRAHSSAPIVGICFGAQAIAAAFGGEVGRNPSGRFRLGVESLEWCNTARQLPALKDMPTPRLVESHGECVKRLPEGSVHLATSPGAVHEIYLLDKRILAVQGHPEVSNRGLTEGFMRVHTQDFSPEAWKTVVEESSIPVERHGVLGLCQQILREGVLQTHSKTTL